MKLGLVVHERDEVIDFARRFVESAQTAGMAVVGDGRVAELVDPVPVSDGTPDMVVAVGGDGTMLAAIQVAIAHDVPIFGFNLGTIGFLTESEPEELPRVVESLVSGDYETVPRMGIRASLNGTTVTGLNDVVVEKIDTLRLVHLEVSVDGEPFLTYRADGLIIATPTGSTAYSFSAGGPLVDHSIEAILMTPVASHSLFARTMVLSPDSVVEVRVRRERPARASLDKVPLGEAQEGDVVEVRRAPGALRFVRFKA
ncbi:MAG: NAD(+)/NADH kinase, partial [Actinomycetota bacterium]